MENFSVREIVEMAVRTEKLGYEYYSEMAKRFKDEKEVYDLFNTLAQKEIIHEKKFSELKDKISEEEPDNWQDVSEYMRAYVESAFFIGKEKSLMHMQNIQNAIGAVGYAIGFEKETLLYFYGMRDIVSEKEIVDEIINEEKSHILWLNKFKEKMMTAS